MRILAIETSCDETAIAVLDANGSTGEPLFKVLSNQILSQIKIHKKFGGVVPNLAMREHKKNLPIILRRALIEAGFSISKTPTLILPLRKGEENLSMFPLPPYEGGRGRGGKGLFLSVKNKPDAIAVTSGPGLEPALWEGINFAKDLAKKWLVPLIPVNHLEGHIYANWLQDGLIPQFPLLALIVSGGHTELVLMKKHLDYKVLGETRDDAAGEAFDKVARMLKLGYPGGPQIARLAQSARKYAEKTQKNAELFPRPMINSGDFDFSFSGLKTAALYYLRDNPNADKSVVAHEFQQAVVDVLIFKTRRALQKYNVKSLVVGGGVAANKKLRATLENMVKKSFPKVSLFLSPLWLTGDNAAMIAVAGYFRFKAKKFANSETIKADGNLRLT